MLFVHVTKNLQQIFAAIWNHLAKLFKVLFMVYRSLIFFIDKMSIIQRAENESWGYLGKKNCILLYNACFFFFWKTFVYVFFSFFLVEREYIMTEL